MQHFTLRNEHTYHFVFWRPCLSYLADVCAAVQPARSRHTRVARPAWRPLQHRRRVRRFGQRRPGHRLGPIHARHGRAAGAADDQRPPAARLAHVRTLATARQRRRPAADEDQADAVTQVSVARPVSRQPAAQVAHRSTKPGSASNCKSTKAKSLGMRRSSWPPASIRHKLEIRGLVDMQVCKEQCVPQKAKFVARLAKRDKSAKGDQLVADEPGLAGIKAPPALDATHHDQRRVQADGSVVKITGRLEPATVQPGQSGACLSARRHDPAAGTFMPTSPRDDQPGSKPTLIAFESAWGLTAGRPTTDAADHDRQQRQRLPADALPSGAGDLDDRHRRAGRRRAGRVSALWRDRLSSVRISPRRLGQLRDSQRRPLSARRSTWATGTVSAPAANSHLPPPPIKMRPPSRPPGPTCSTASRQNRRSCRRRRSPRRLIRSAVRRPVAATPNVRSHDRGQSV